MNEPDERQLRDLLEIYCGLQGFSSISLGLAYLHDLVQNFYSLAHASLFPTPSGGATISVDMGGTSPGLLSSKPGGNLAKFLVTW